ncbi:LysM peptidoglycan-binding domain-containing protein [uncultured Algibacter sp.]|uniref:LysM peptidoglycan-binding domain-containing protein n=1 Tax=uncultured Algibacter sp. TaxID=298659 RepID=UPI002621E1D2|nr:LysM peptidoglycan-binding domain-containing protein [uncultured Algibacter sp.]
MNRFLLVLALILVFSFNTIQAQNFSSHQVKQGETIEGISKLYYLTPLDIYEYNPDTKNGLKPNTVLIIPILKANKPKVTVTKELKGFKPHKTKKRQTLYSLSKLYNVSEEDIKKYNKFLYSNPLRKGDKLQIPIFEIIEVVEEVKSTTEYTVQPKEGKWRIAYKYGITVQELEFLNPEMADVLKEGEVINVPNLEAENQNKFDEKYSYYKVLPKEGFYRLKLKLGLEQSELETLNPDLKETGLKSGMILKIPFSEEIAGLSEENLKSVNLIDSISLDNSKHIAVMLPFRLNRVDFDSISDAKRSIKNDPYLNASLDFYSGVLVAIDSLKKLGISLKVDVYDTRYQVSEVSDILNTNSFEEVDAVIGPLTTSCFDKVASELRMKNVPVVSPIGTKLELHENVFQSRPSNDLLKEKIVNFVKADSISNILIVSDTENVKVSDEIKKEFNLASQVKSRKNKDGEDEFFVTKDDIEKVLKPGKNVVFLETQDAGFVSNVTSILASLIREEDKELKQEAIEITLVTTQINGAFQGDQINNTHLSILNFHFPAVSKEYSELDNNSFVKKYTKLYNITPNKRAVKGFDLTMDTVLRLVSSNGIYMSVNNAPLTEYVENKFAYKKNLAGGYYNNTVYLLKYEDLSIVEVKQ